MPPDDDLSGFTRLVEALRPFLEQTIVVGGWTHRLYRLHPETTTPDHPPLLTKDTDIAVTPANAPAGSTNLKTRLLEHGFTEEFLGEAKPPVTHYRLGDGNFYAEFLTPLVGSTAKKGGSPKATEKMGGVVAQSLRYLEVLLVAPWTVTLSATNGFALDEPARVNIANPVSYVVQKLLIFSKRKPDDRAKDVLYIHDTIELFSSSLPALRTIWTDNVRPTLLPMPKSLGRLQKTRQKLLAQQNDDVRNAAAIAADRPLDASSLLERCQLGLNEILGPAEK